MKVRSPKYILLDIEGTTTEISFVHQVLFPFSKKNMNEFVNNNSDAPEVSSALDLTKATLEEENGLKNPTLEDCASQLISWIEADRKHPGLKKIQGLIWKVGYDSGDLKSHVYEDVLPAFKKWTNDGIILGIYSSGSVAAQKLLFGHTIEGNLLPYLSDFFDLEFGAKREKRSYSKIADHITEKYQISNKDILFLSDVPEEVLAAKSVDLCALHITRPGTPKNDQVGKAINSFSELVFD